MGGPVIIIATDNKEYMQKRTGGIMSMYRQEKRAKNRTMKNGSRRQTRRNEASKGNGNSLKRDRKSR